MVASSRAVVGLTVVLAAVFVASAISTGELDRDRIWRDTAILAANTLPLLALRRNPLAVTITFAIAYPLWIVSNNSGHVLQSLPTLAAMYATGAWDRPLWLRGIALLTPVWMVIPSIIGWWDADPLEIGYVGVVFVVVWVLGAVVAGRRAYTAELEAKTAQLEAARRQLADRAVADERARIARELHDIIAHAMTVITVQAGVGAHLLGTQPEQAAESLRIIEQSGREALGEMRRMLWVLRDGESGEETADPQPGLNDLPRLIDAVREAGMEVTVRTVGEPRPLPAGLDLTLYRIVQEALTNLSKHAPGASASVAVRHSPTAVTAEVVDDGGDTVSRPTDPVVPGQGIRGMTERARMYGGAIETVREPAGFRVTATFPLESAE